MNLRKKLFRSLSSTINTFYVLFITSFLLLAGSIIYLVANNQVNQNTAETMDSVLNQKMEYLSFLYKDIFEQFYRLSQNLTVQRLADSTNPSPQLYLQLSEEVEYVYQRNASFVDSIYININDTYEIAHSEQQEMRPSFEAEAFYPPPTTSREGYYWRNNHIDPIFNRDQPVQSIVHLLETTNGEPAGVFVMNLKTSFIERTLTDLASQGSYMMLLSEEGYFVSPDAPHHPALDAVIYEQYQAGELTREAEEINLRNLSPYLVRYSQLGTNKWGVVLVTPKQSLFDLNAWMLLLFVILSFLLAFLIAIMIRTIRRYISIPIEQLADSMMTTESYHEKLQWPEDMPEELAVLYTTYNSLTDRNVYLIEQMTAQQNEKLELEVALLHAQISPHFLYNTLFSIKGLCDMGMNKEASQMISKLSDFFRTSLSRGKEIIPIREELKNIESYLYMMEMRYGDFFQYEINIPEEWHDYLVVKLTLQPLVENAIYHGVMNDREQGLIRVGCEEIPEGLLLYVEDNGQGIESEKLARIQAEIHTPYLGSNNEETGVGLRSVDIRLKNRYGNQYGLRMESEVGKYTRVSVKIPKLKGGDYVV
ncbi:cache domain-containing sensor histidine kinase [Jeotgalibaca caeni]|uniref:cache domain-containing sensor histidine kinase n=1 Tax=Jeotgalibaca caeni TaxID=3028623 RepID=UPI00237E78EE|nr:sensor histidine kinase [Jeotgalibaca caeni]MDE1548625.1 sensor histidine kinase [Jeotgalibaca caeni]